jgi:hypothetical protein
LVLCERSARRRTAPIASRIFISSYEMHGRARRLATGSRKAAVRAAEIHHAVHDHGRR